MPRLSRTLVTGASGFIGRALRSRMREAEGLDIVPGPVTNIVTDICRFKDAGDYDVIFHFAAVTDPARTAADPSECYRVNVNGTISLLKDFHGLFVYASGYGFHCPLICPLYMSQYLAEQIVEKHDEHIIFRLGNAYGPRGMGVVNKFLTRDEITIYGDGEQVRDFVWLGDMVGQLLGAEYMKRNRVYHVGTGVATTINRLAEVVNSALEEPKPVIHKPERPYDVKHPVIRADLVCGTSLEEGVRATLDRMRATWAAYQPATVTLLNPKGRVKPGRKEDGEDEGGQGHSSRGE